MRSGRHSCFHLADKDTSQEKEPLLWGGAVGGNGGHSVSRTGNSGRRDLGQPPSAPHFHHTHVPEMISHGNGGEVRESLGAEHSLSAQSEAVSALETQGSPSLFPVSRRQGREPFSRNTQPAGTDALARGG